MHEHQPSVQRGAPAVCRQGLVGGCRGLGGKCSDRCERMDGRNCDRARLILLKPRLEVEHNLRVASHAESHTRRFSSLFDEQPHIFKEKWSWKACISMPRDFLRGGRRGFQSGGGASSCCCRLRWVCPLRRPFQRGTAKGLEKWTCPWPGETTNVGRRNRRGKERPRSRSEISESPAIQRPRALTPDQKSSPPRPTRAPRETASSLPPQTHNLHNTTGVVCLDV